MSLLTRLTVALAACLAAAAATTLAVASAPSSPQVGSDTPGAHAAPRSVATSHP